MSAPDWEWTDIVEHVLGEEAAQQIAPWQRSMLTLTLNNSAGTFTPKPKPKRVKPRIRFRAGRRWSRWYRVVIWDELALLDAPARARLSGMRSEYRRRRR